MIPTNMYEHCSKSKKAHAKEYDDVVILNVHTMGGGDIDNFAF